MICSMGFPTDTGITGKESLHFYRNGTQGECYGEDCKAVYSMSKKYAFDVEKVLKELLRLYDWRFELAAREKTGDQTVKTDLRKYGEQKKAAWEID